MTTLFTRPVEYRVLVTLKTFDGIFKPETKRHEFSFCADSGEGAKVAASNVRSKGWPHDEVLVQVLGAIPVKREAEVLPMVHAQLRSLSEVQSERDEAA